MKITYELLPNYHGRSDVDDQIAGELEMAGITAHRYPEFMRGYRSPVPSGVFGSLIGWYFIRQEQSWLCLGPGREHHVSTYHGLCEHADQIRQAIIKENVLCS